MQLVGLATANHMIDLEKDLIDKSVVQRTAGSLQFPRERGQLVHAHLHLYVTD